MGQILWFHTAHGDLRLQGAWPVAEGEQVHLGWPAGRELWFDTATGLRLP